MSTALNLAGQRFGRLTAIKRTADYNGGNVRWICVCDCGREKIANTSKLRLALIQSCGCLKTESSVRNGYATRTHGLSQLPLYKVWDGMRYRCHNANAAGYAGYGGRGIRVCDEWRYNPGKFMAWALLNGYQCGLQIDRIDNDGNYEPSNCRFVSPKTNSDNRRSSRQYPVNGELLTITDAIRKYAVANITYHIVSSRLKYGWAIERALTTPPQTRRRAP